MNWISIEFAEYWPISIISVVLIKDQNLTSLYLKILSLSDLKSWVLNLLNSNKYRLNHS